MLLHMTGLDRVNEVNRYHFATDEGTVDYDDLVAMVEAGLARGPSKWSEELGGLSFFHVTPAGVEAAVKAKAEADVVKVKKKVVKAKKGVAKKEKKAKKKGAEG